MINEIKFNILDELVDAITPFAVIFSSLVCERGYLLLSIDNFVREIGELFGAGLLICKKYQEEGGYQEILEMDENDLREKYFEYLADQIICDIEYDEVGFYFAMTEAGRIEWDEYARIFSGFVQNEEDKWSIDESMESKTVKISAANIAVAEKLLEYWKKNYKNKKIIPSTIQSKVTLFRPKYYEKKLKGQQITFSYEIIGE